MAKTVVARHLRRRADQARQENWHRAVVPCQSAAGMPFGTITPPPPPKPSRMRYQRGALFTEKSARCAFLGHVPQEEGRARLDGRAARCV
eukprot:7627619-Pyramimonas_sp.AAC.1